MPKNPAIVIAHNTVSGRLTFRGRTYQVIFKDGSSISEPVILTPDVMLKGESFNLVIFEHDCGMYRAAEDLTRLQVAIHDVAMYKSRCGLENTMRDIWDSVILAKEVQRDIKSIVKDVKAIELPKISTVISDIQRRSENRAKSMGLRAKKGRRRAY